MHIALPQPEGEQGAVDACQGMHGVFIVPVGYDEPVFRHQAGKGAEGVLHILQIVKKVQMVGLNVEDDGDGGEKGEEGIAVFAGLQDNGVSPAHPVAGAQKREGASDHHRGIKSGGHDNMGTHGSGGGFAVSARYAQRVLIPAHKRTPGLRAFEDGNARRPCGGDLGVSVVDGGGADNKLGRADIGFSVTDCHRNAQCAQVLHRGALLKIRAGDNHAHAGEHLGQRSHGDAAGTHQMGAATGPDVFVDVASCHGVYTPFM